MLIIMINIFNKSVPYKTYKILTYLVLISIKHNNLLTVSVSLLKR